MIPYEEVSLEVVDSLINKEFPLAFDTETCGFYNRIRLAQFFQEGWDCVRIVNNPNPMHLAALLNPCWVIMHNAHYDITTIQCQLDIFWEPLNYDDTFYLSRLRYYHKDKFDLESVMTYVLEFDPYEQAGLDKTAMQKSDWDTLILTEDQKLYASIDVYYLLDVFNETKRFMDDTSYRMDMLATHYSLDFQRNGMPVLADAVIKQYEENTKRIQEINLPINANSWKQVRPYIESNMSDGLGLATLTLQGNERAKDVNETRKLLKQNSFLNKFDVETGYVYGKFKPSARSGRFTCADQNLEQIPRKLKKVFGYDPNDGKVLIYADYAQLEMRTICAIVGEYRLQQLFKEYGDVHTYTTKMIFGEDYLPHQRQIAKTANFNLLYGGGANMFISILIKEAQLLLQEYEAKNIKLKWLNLWTAINAWQQEGIKAYQRGEAWSTPFGRKYTAKMMTDQLNIQNQGFGAEVAKLAMHYMYNKIKDTFNNEVKLCNFIHDSYIYRAPADEEIYIKASEIIAEAMQKAWFEALRVGKDLKIRDIPMPVEVYVGYNWGLIEKDHIYKHELIGYEYNG